MKFNEYQIKSAEYDLSEETEDLRAVGFIEKVLGLAGEAGETADKIKKILRDKNGVISNDDRTAVTMELGDTLWYIAAIARYLKVDLSDIAQENLSKLESRKQRNKLHGEGDIR